MFKFVSRLSHFKILLAVLVVAFAITLKYISIYLKQSNVNRKAGILTANELSKYNSIDDKKIYLAIIGTIFDVTKGEKHYSKEGAYHYFVGKDGSRAFVTGNFKDESAEKDHILDLACNNLLDLLQWRRTFKHKYTYVGVLSGRYYNDDGEDTEYMKAFKEKIKQCKLEKEENKKREQLYPPCNISWSENDGTQVWCTISSGGIVRNWEGVPRELYSPGKDKSHCVCVKAENLNNTLLKEYDGCPSSSSRCTIQKS